MTFVNFWLELMMILMFLTGEGIFDDILDGVHMPWGNYDKNLFEIWCAWRYQELPQILLTFLEFLLELMMILMFLAGAGVLDYMFYGLHMPWGGYVQNLVEIHLV